MLIGEYRNTIDEKWRVKLPAKLNAALEGKNLYITPGFDECLFLMDEQFFNQFCNTIAGNSASMFTKNLRLLQRKYIAPSQKIELDKSNRFLISPSLRKGALLELKEDVVFLGVSTHIELWNAKAYEAYLEKEESTSISTIEQLGFTLSQDK